jgi:hypothetical protein
MITRIAKQAFRCTSIGRRDISHPKEEMGSCSGNRKISRACPEVKVMTKEEWKHT